MSSHQTWGLGGDDTLYGWTLDNPDLETSDELYGDRVPQPGQIQYDPNVNPPGEPGNDQLYGGGGSDRLYGDKGNDDLYGGIGDDRLFGGEGDDYLDGWEGDDILYGGKDLLPANGDPSPFERNTGNDVLVAWTGDDRLYGGDGDDWLDGSHDNDKLYGGDGNDLLGNQYLQGELGDDEMYGQGGNDGLYGGDGNDLLNGYGNQFYERDTLTGGANADKFILGTSDEAFYASDGSWGYAVITDFHKYSQGDQILAHGSKDSYRLDSSINWFGESANDTAIYYKDDLIGVVQDKTYTSRAELLTFV